MSCCWLWLFFAYPSFLVDRQLGCWSRRVSSPGLQRTGRRAELLGGVSRAKWPNVKKGSLEIRFARRSDARLSYPTLTGWHQVCITRQDDPALRLPTNRGRENHLFVPSVPPLRLTLTRGRTDNSEHRAWQALEIIILIPARDATQRRGAATTRQEAGLGARGVPKTTTGTGTSKHQDSDPQAHKQPTRRHNRCKPDGRKHGHSAYHPHP